MERSACLWSGLVAGALVLAVSQGGLAQDCNQDGIDDSLQLVKCGLILSVGASYPAPPDPNSVPIPDNNFTGVWRTIHVTQNVPICDLRLHLNITHGSPGQLIVKLRHDESATEITVIDKIGNPNPHGSTGECGFGLDVLLWDDAASSIEFADPQGNSCGHWIVGQYIPYPQLLAAFDGETSQGDWTLKVLDVKPGVTGYMNSWSLDFYGQVDNDCNDNGVPDECDIDPDWDGTAEFDCNGNGTFDGCEADSDGDGLIDGCDNCPAVYNPDQADGDADGTGDACDAVFNPGCPAYWDGAFGAPGMNGTVYALTVLDGELYVGGDFTIAGGVSANDIAKWNPATNTWSALGSGMGGASYHYVYALAVLDGELYAGGAFTTAGGVSANNIAKWDPATSTWSALGDVMGGGSYPYPHVYALTALDGELYVGGEFTTAGGVSANDIAKWNPATSTWSALGSGMGGYYCHVVYALTVLDGELYAGGCFTTAGGVSANDIAKWNPGTSTWGAVGTGIPGSSFAVYALTSASEGGGPVLYAGGGFSTARVHVNNVARYDPSTGTWSALGQSWNVGTDQPVRCLAVLDDAGGPALYVGGEFTAAGGLPANHLARWDRQRQIWAPAGSGTNATVFALAELASAGSGSLYAGGSFTAAGGNAAQNVARWLMPQTDSDGDGYLDECDNCPTVYNPDQADTDADDIGDACDGPGACCLTDGTCQLLTPAACAALPGTYLGDGTVCEPNPCPPPTGACCFCDGSCLDDQIEADCLAAGGWYRGHGSTCPAPQFGCQPVPMCGACCVGTTCTVSPESTCTALGGAYQGDLTTCEPNPCAICRGDSNCDGQINWRDIDYFVAAMTGEQAWRDMFLPGAPTCLYGNNDVNGDSTVNWRDIDPFVARMGAVCP